MGQRVFAVHSSWPVRYIRSRAGAWLPFICSQRGWASAKCTSCACTRLFREHRDNDFAFSSPLTLYRAAFALGVAGLNLEPISLTPASRSIDEPINLSRSVATPEEYILWSLRWLFTSSRTWLPALFGIWNSTATLKIVDHIFSLLANVTYNVVKGKSSLNERERERERSLSRKFLLLGKQKRVVYCYHEWWCINVLPSFFLSFFLGKLLYEIWKCRERTEYREERYKIYKHDDI